MAAFTISMVLGRLLTIESVFLACGVLFEDLYAAWELNT
jgi:hypothetical protein